MPLYNVAPSTSANNSSSENIITDSLSTTATQILAANSNRKGLTVYNPLSSTVYLDGTNAVSTSSYLIPLPPNYYYEFPYNYQGALWGILASGAGSVQVREFI